MNTRTKLFLVATVPATLCVTITMFLAIKDMDVQRAYMAQLAVEMLQSSNSNLTPEQILTELTIKGDEKYAELASMAIPGILTLLSILVISAVLLVKKILRELNYLVHKVKEMSRPDTPLSFRFNPEKCKEFKQLSVDLNAMLERIEAVMIKVKGMSDDFLTTSQILNDSSRSNLNSAESLSSNMNNVNQAANQLGESSGEISRNVDEAHREVSDVNKQGQQITTDVSTLNHQLDELISTSDTSSNDVGELSEKIEGIYGILQTIQGIAEQTNLLALNAAIEAARAGEQGRGFAVVADEVRNLASKTQQSTEEIATMISGLREGADRSIKAMTQSSEATQKLAESINQSNEKVLSLFDRLTTVNSMNSQIAAASEQQVQVIHDITNNISQAETLSRNAHESADRMEDQATALEKNTGELNTLISQFKF